MDKGLSGIKIIVSVKRARVAYHPERSYKFVGYVKGVVLEINQVAAHGMFSYQYVFYVTSKCLVKFLFI